jgi:DNA-binding transcriptional ArsR family regulator
MTTQATRTELGHLPTVCRLVWALNDRALGRRTLVERTGITESTVRTHLTKLRRAGLVRMDKAGTSLTSWGLEAFASLFENVRWTGSLSLNELALDRHNAAALLTDTAEEFKESWRYRDAAVREGATGALLLVKRPDGGWAFSDEPLRLSERYPEDAAQIEKALPQAEPGDALVVTFGSESREARDGLWRVIVELFPPSPSKHIRNTEADCT